MTIHHFNLICKIFKVWFESVVKLTLSKSSAFVQTNADSSQGKLSSLQKLCLDTPVNEVSLSE